MCFYREKKFLKFFCQPFKGPPCQNPKYNFVASKNDYGQLLEILYRMDILPCIFCQRYCFLYRELYIYKKKANYYYNLAKMI